MAVDVKAEILIKRPREVVASVMFNPKYDRIWILGISKSFPLDLGILRKGMRVEHVGEFMKRRFSTILTVTNDVPDKMVELNTDEPFPMRVRYELKDEPEGTLTSVRVQSVGEIPFKTTASILSKAVREKIESELRRLKRHCEEFVD
jgi:hypothetical protein